METSYFYLAMSGVLTLLLWTPYILARAAVWGIPAFLHNYPEEFPRTQPQQPLWAERAQRVHLNMVETMPAFIAVVVASAMLVPEQDHGHINLWAEIFFFARLAHALVYIGGLPFLRTPVYLVSWASVLMIGWLAIG